MFFFLNFIVEIYLLFKLLKIQIKINLTNLIGPKSNVVDYCYCFFFQMQYPLALVGSVNVHMFGLKYNDV